MDGRTDTKTLRTTPYVKWLSGFCSLNDKLFNVLGNCQCSHGGTWVRVVGKLPAALESLASCNDIVRVCVPKNCDGGDLNECVHLSCGFGFWTLNWCLYMVGWLVGWGLDLPLQIVSLEVINAMLHFVTWFRCQIEDNALVYVSGCLTVSWACDNSHNFINNDGGHVRNDGFLEELWCVLDNLLRIF